MPLPMPFVGPAGSRSQSWVALITVPQCSLCRLQVFAELARIGPVLPPEEEAAVTCHWPFRTVELPGEPHPGLRAYPFLGQVCK